MIIKRALSLDDVLLVPQYSTVRSRAEVDMGVTINGHRYHHPIIPANMKTITGEEMADAIAASGGLAILHRFMRVEDQVHLASKLIQKYSDKSIAVSIGVQSQDQENLRAFHEVGVRMVCIDIAHGHSQVCVEMIDFIRQHYPDVFIIAGNVANGAGAWHLWNAGAHMVKVGIGAGSLCSTRIETGNGVPTLQSLIEVKEMARQLSISIHGHPNSPLPFIADGGLKNAGDITKALCFADMVMVGNIFAGCHETPGKVLSIDGVGYKEYVGSSTHKSNRVEGVAAIVPAKGTYQEILTKLTEGIQSGCSYQGCKNLVELKEDPIFMEITGAGLRESHPHDVKVVG